MTNTAPKELILKVRTSNTIIIKMSVHFLTHFKGETLCLFKINSPSLRMNYSLTVKPLSSLLHFSLQSSVLRSKSGST